MKKEKGSQEQSDDRGFGSFSLPPSSFQPTERERERERADGRSRSALAMAEDDEASTWEKQGERRRKVVTRGKQHSPKPSNSVWLGVCDVGVHDDRVVLTFIGKGKVSAVLSLCEFGERIDVFGGMNSLFSVQQRYMHRSWHRRGTSSCYFPTSGAQFRLLRTQIRNPFSEVIVTSTEGVVLFMLVA